MEPDYVRALRPFFADKPVLLAMEIAAGTGAFAEQLRELGASDVFLIAANEGIGEIPNQAELPHRILGVEADTLMGGFRAADAAFLNLPPDIVDWVDRLDPDREAVVITGPFGGKPEIAGRATFADRPASWTAIEDKTTIDKLWQATDTPIAPFEVIDLHATSVNAAFDRLDTGHGIVLAGDNKEGWHGGGEYVRWVRTPDEVDEILTDFGTRSDRARVMPFLEGLPCSIHGLVVPHRTLTFRPVEMVILRRPQSAQFQYGGLSTGWDPSAADRAMMIATAERVGEHLRTTVDYRGAFSIDGIMTADGFRPTELNPRLSGAFSLFADGIENLRLGLINRALIAGHTLDIDWDGLGQAMIDAADATRSARCTIPLYEDVEDPTSVSVAWDGQRWQEETEIPTAKISVGQGVGGGLIMFVANPEALTPGPSVAPLVVAAAAYADEHLGTSVGELIAAPNLRT